MTQQKSSTFENVYTNLNNAQKIAVNTIEGPVMVIAGPGTGKTQVLSARIANILLKTDINPANILALTFTDSASQTMRDRLVNMIGTSGYYVTIHTFHSFCVEVMKSNPEFFTLSHDSKPISEIERFQLLQEIINQENLNLIRPINKKYFYLKDIVSSISQLKREAISPEGFKKILYKSNNEIEDKNVLKNKELLQVYEEYQIKLQQYNRFDFEDMIGFVTTAFKKHKELLLEYQEKLHFVLVDEYQDTNNSQNMLLRQLMSFWGDRANIFVVLDPNQSIYRFQGASTENALLFSQWYPDAKIVKLNIGYRSTTSIYETAHLLLQENNLQYTIKKELVDENKPLKSINNEKGLITITQYPSQLVETIAITTTIKKLIKDGVDPKEIAVLYRQNNDALLFREAFEKWGISYELDGGDNILNNEAIRQLLLLCRFILTIQECGENHDLFEIASYEWLNIKPAVVLKVAEIAGKSNVSFYDLCNKNYDVFSQINSTNKISKSEFKTLHDLIKKIHTWANKDANLVFPEWFENVINESGFLDWILKHNEKVELLTNLWTLFQEIKSQSRSNHAFKLRQFINLIDTLSEFNLELKAEDFNIIEKAVKLSTVHRAKGCEWKYVFLVHCINGKWGNNHAREMFKLPNEIVKNTDLSKKEQNEDERRIFYVGLTRAKSYLYISYPNTFIAENGSKTTIPSMFINELSQKHPVISDNSMQTQKSALFMEEFLRPKSITFYNQIEKSFYKKLVQNITYSITTINTYLKDRETFIRNDLLRVPRAKPGFMAFGTAIHTVLEEFYTYFQKTGRIFTIEEVCAMYKTALSKEILTISDFDARYKYGVRVLTGYYNTYLTNPETPYIIERHFGKSFRPLYLGDIPISGRIDRLDWISKKDKTVLVIDYKTGKPKTMGEIEGRTVSSQLSDRELKLHENIRGQYKRQLLFYKLLFELDPMVSETVEMGEFDFVEPDKQTGKYIKRKMSLEKSDVALLKQCVQEIVHEIRSLSFLN